MVRRSSKGKRSRKILPGLTSLEVASCVGFAASLMGGCCRGSSVLSGHTICKTSLVSADEFMVGIHRSAVEEASGVTSAPTAHRNCADEVDVQHVSQWSVQR